MQADVFGGLFALGGVALAGVLAEVRAVREARSRGASELASLKRDLYAEAIQRTEAVASRAARWVAAPPKDAAAREAVWDALAAAYDTSNRIRITAETQRPADAMNRLLRAYRDALEKDDRRLPVPTEDRAEMIRQFRGDMGRPEG